MQKGGCLKLQIISHIHSFYYRETISVDTATIKIGATKYIDTGGGFLREEVEGQESAEVSIYLTNNQILKVSSVC